MTSMNNYRSTFGLQPVQQSNQLRRSSVSQQVPFNQNCLSVDYSKPTKLLGVHSITPQKSPHKNEINLDIEMHCNINEVFEAENRRKIASRPKLFRRLSSFKKKLVRQFSSTDSGRKSCDSSLRASPSPHLVKNSPKISKMPVIISSTATVCNATPLTNRQVYKPKYVRSLDNKDDVFTEFSNFPNRNNQKLAQKPRNCLVKTLSEKEFFDELRTRNQRNSQKNSYGNSQAKTRRHRFSERGQSTYTNPRTSFEEFSGIDEIYEIFKEEKPYVLSTIRSPVISKESLPRESKVISPRRPKIISPQIDRNTSDSLDEMEMAQERMNLFHKQHTIN